MAIDVESIAATLSSLNDVLSELEGALIGLESRIDRVERWQNTVVDAPVALATMIDPICGRLGRMDVADLQASLTSELERLEVEFGTLPNDVDGVVGRFEAALDALTDGLGDRLDALGEEATDAVEELGELLAGRIEALTDHVDELLGRLDQTIGEVGDVLSGGTDRVERVREAGLGAAAEFVERVDGSLGRVVDALDGIQKALDPVMPVIERLEAVA